MGWVGELKERGESDSFREVRVTERERGMDWAMGLRVGRQAERERGESDWVELRMRRWVELRHG